MSRSTIFGLTFSVLLIYFSLLLPSTAFSFSSKDDLALDDSFFGMSSLNDQNWVGADVGTSFSVKCGATEHFVWIFGDTLVGQEVQGNDCHRSWKGFPRNSIGVAKSAATGPITFFYGGNATASESFFKSKNEPSHWLWPVSGYYSGGKLNTMFFFTTLLTSDNSTFGFKEVATVVIKVEDVCVGETLSDPKTWQWTVSDGIPGTGDDNGLSMCQAVAQADDDSVYLIGRKKAGESDMCNVIGKISIDALAKEDFSELYYYLGSGGWVKGASTKSYCLFHDGLSEATLQYHPYMKQCKFFNAFSAFIFANELTLDHTTGFVLGNSFLSSSFYIRMAPEVTGPWSDEIVIYEATHYNDTKHFMYAAKSHPECTTEAAGNEISFTFNINSFKMEDTLDNCYVYIPKFVKVLIDDD